MLSALPRLTGLEVLESVFVQADGDVEFLATLTQLKRLAVKSSHHYGTRGILQLSRLTGLQALQFVRPCLEKAILQKLVGSMRSLRDLVLSSWDGDVEQMGFLLASLPAVMIFGESSHVLVHNLPEKFLPNGFASLRSLSMSVRSAAVNFP